ncbi:MAG TPA: hypothetical protein VMV01_02480 [Planctomycetota bacterium]|nr:hypothetical protein [Planctomycetota bacterium]
MPRFGAVPTTANVGSVRLDANIVESIVWLRGERVLLDWTLAEL